jgi:hypothetical protein
MTKVLMRNERQIQSNFGGLVFPDHEPPLVALGKLVPEIRRALSFNDTVSVETRPRKSHERLECIVRVRP